MILIVKCAISGLGNWAFCGQIEKCFLGICIVFDLSECEKFNFNEPSFDGRMFLFCACGK